MSVLLFVLRLLGIVLLALLAVVMVLLVCPAWVEVAYDGHDFSAAARVLGLKIKLLPRKDNGKPKKKKVPKAPTEKASAQMTSEKQGTGEAEKSAATVQNREKPVKKPGPNATDEEKAKFALNEALSLVETATVGVKRLFAHLRIDRVCLCLPIRGSDAAVTALRFGRVNAWLGGGLAVLQNCCRLTVKRIDLIPMFDESREERLTFSCRFGLSPVVLLSVGLYAWRRLKAQGIL